MSAPSGNKRSHSFVMIAVPVICILGIALGILVNSYRQSILEPTAADRKAAAQAVIDDPNLGIRAFDNKNEHSRDFLDSWRSAVLSMYGNHIQYHSTNDGTFMIRMAAYPDNPITDPTLTCLNRIQMGKFVANTKPDTLKGCLEREETATYGSWVSKPCTTLPYAMKYGYSNEHVGMRGLMYCLNEITGPQRMKVKQALKLQFDNSVAAKATVLTDDIARKKFASERTKLEAIARYACDNGDRATVAAAEKVFYDSLNDGSYESLLRDAQRTTQRESAFDEIVAYVCSQ